MDAMIGQKSNLELIANWRFNKSMPRFILIQGEIGSGRYTLATKIADLLSVFPVVCNTSKEDIRDVLNGAYLLCDVQCYIFRDIDNISDAAKNTLLKTVEEPPNNCYFIMTLEDFSNIPTTIISRAFTLTMNPYTINELTCFTDNDNLLKYCSTPGQILCWEDRGFDEFVEFCKNATETIYSGSGVKSLQLSNSLKTKATEEDGYDPDFFLKIIFKMLTQRIQSEIKSKDYLTFIKHTSDTQKLLRNKSIKRDSLIDDYILWVRDFLDETVS